MKNENKRKLVTVELLENEATPLPESLVKKFNNRTIIEIKMKTENGYKACCVSYVKHLEDGIVCKLYFIPVGLPVSPKENFFVKPSQMFAISTR